MLPFVTHASTGGDSQPVSLPNLPWPHGQLLPLLSADEVPVRPLAAASVVHAASLVIGAYITKDVQIKV